MLICQNKKINIKFVYNKISNLWLKKKKFSFKYDKNKFVGYRRTSSNNLNTHLEKKETINFYNAQLEMKLDIPWRSDYKNFLGNIHLNNYTQFFLYNINFKELFG